MMRIADLMGGMAEDAADFGVGMSAQQGVVVLLVILPAVAVGPEIVGTGRLDEEIIQLVPQLVHSPKRFVVCKRIRTGSAVCGNTSAAAVTGPAKLEAMAKIQFRQRVYHASSGTMARFAVYSLGHAAAVDLSPRAVFGIETGGMAAGAFFSRQPLIREPVVLSGRPVEIMTCVMNCCLHADPMVYATLSSLK